MSWNYRIVKKIYDYETDIEIQFGIHEVFYNDKDEIKNYTLEPVEVASDTIEGVRWKLEEMLKALDRAIINFEDEIFVSTLKK